jgi:protoporphyrinogen oxidase
LYSQYGSAIAEKYPIQYTKKYWDISPELLSTSWIGNRMRKADAREILRGTYTDETPNDYYTKEMRYPEKGGYKNFLKDLIKNASYELNKEITLIDLASKIVKCKDESEYNYEYLISSIPLPELVNLCKNLPEKVKDAAKNLMATSIDLVSIGFNKVIEFDKIWFYIYDPEIYASRAYWPSKKSANNAPINKSSIQFEAYSLGKESKYDKQMLLENTLEAIEKFGFASKEDIEVIDHRRIKYGNVVFYKGMEEDRSIIRNYFKSNLVHTIGRFGEWDYLWSNQAFISGYGVEI